MAHFSTVVALDHTKVTWRLVQTILVLIFFLLTWLIRLCCIGSGGRGGAFLSLSIVPVLLFLLAGLFGGLRLLSSRCFGLLRFGPRFFYSRIFHGVALRLSSSGGDGPAPPETVLVRLPGIEARPKSGLGLGIDGFFYELFETIKLAAALFHLVLN